MSILDIAYFILIMPIQLILETFFMLAYRVIDNPGISIIVLSLAMNFLVLPLYMRADKMQEREREVEAKLHDGVAHIRKTFKGDEKMMMLQTYYRQNNYKPTDVLKGSVSLFLEIPFFIAAYAYLSHLGLLDGVSFWFIQNLGAPDGLLTIGDVHINVLPFVMTAINLATCLLFTKGMPRKTKVQLYVMAVLFLVLLYGSPAGLVFYWTLNNVFSFVKTLFYKLKNPKRVLAILFAVAGIALMIFSVVTMGDRARRKTALILVLGILLLIPIAVAGIRSVARKKAQAPQFSLTQTLQSLPGNKKLYVGCALFLTLLYGALIPSAVISASPQEFTFLAYYVNPAWYIVSSLCLAAGTFLVWMSVFYWLTSSKYKGLFQVILLVLCMVSVVDYMFFGTNLGQLENNLRLQEPLAFTRPEMLLNLVVLVVVSVALVLLYFRIPKKMPVAVVVVCAAMAGMSLYNVFNIEQGIEGVAEASERYQQSKPSFSLNKEGKNVVIIMLDRALGEYVPFIFNEKPELKEVFSGFTCYENVISFGAFTNSGTPALYGGYEYTPVEMNKRDEELLVDKHNEALKVLPVLFDQNDYEVTFCDPTYAGYNWIPDLSIFDEYEDIDTYITTGWFTSKEDSEALVAADKRNFFYYALMKGTPLFAQPMLYDAGNYNRAAARTEESIQDVSNDGLVASGESKLFLDSYTVLKNLDALTVFSDEGDSPGSFVILSNDTTHEPMVLQEPDYTPIDQVDNTDYETEHHDRFRLPEGEIVVENNTQYAHYQSNMAVFLQVGRWLEYLKQNDVYDNTRIILVSDHGRDAGSRPDLGNYEFFYPLLMVKDYNATGFTISNEFMTNADVPTLAVQGLIENPVNPFTGARITNSEKTAHDQYTLITPWHIDENDGTTFLPGTWYSVHTDMRDPANWQRVEDPNS